MMQSPDPLLEFTLDEPPTLPTRSPSGHPIKARVIRAMAQQHEAARGASEALDNLVHKLRLVMSDRPPAPLAPVVPRPAASRPYVLFVDDDRSNLVVWKAACEKKFPVLTATDAVQAMELMRQFDVAVVLADQRMPDTTGVELLEKVRRLYPDAVRILVTAYSDLTVVIDAINRCQVWRYLKKPWDSTDLEKTIREALMLHQRSRATAAE